MVEFRPNCRRFRRRRLRPLRAEFGTLARPDREPLVALNTMLAEDGAVLSRAGGVDAGLLLLVSVATDRAAFHPRHAIHMAPGSRLTLLELSFGDGSLSAQSGLRGACGGRTPR